MANSFLYFYLPIGSIFALYWLTKLLSIILTQCQRKNTMPTTNQVMLTNIQKFSETLSEPQLNKFLDIPRKNAEVTLIYEKKNKFDKRKI